MTRNTASGYITIVGLLCGTAGFEAGRWAAAATQGSPSPDARCQCALAVAEALERLSVSVDAPAPAPQELARWVAPRE